MSMSKRQVKKTVKELLKRGWIKENELGELSVTPKGAEEMEKRELFNDD